MRLADLSELELPVSADFHVHLRDGPMMDLVVLQSVKVASTRSCLPRPPAVPRAERHFLMSLYLHSSITPATIAEAAAAGIAGVKSYPAGVTTNSASGVLSYEPFYPVFEAMQEHDLVLNLHGELPPSAGEEITVMNAEEAFLPTLEKLHKKFPRLRIVLEHCTTAAACGGREEVRADGGSDDHGASFAAYPPRDRSALLHAVVAGGGRFFFGSDSAPHDVKAKQGGKKAAAGCFTQGWATQLVLEALEEAIAKKMLDEEDIRQPALEGFLSGFGRKFYKLKANENARILLSRSGEKIPDIIKSKDGEVSVVPFASGKEVWSLKWKE
ncbi:hypothetical protein MRB53_041874 [Persea americana]|nr:hypothetical protein MRB53_041874 [Persea americana]